MVSPGRIGAARALLAVEQGALSDDALEEHLAGKKDRDLGWFLALGVLRHRAEIDAALRPFLRQPLASMDAPVRAVLRLSTFEKLYSRTAAHAVVHQAVEVARKVGAGRASGLVNAVMRRVQPAKDLQRHEELNLPPWLLARWDERYGPGAVDVWARSVAGPAPLVVVAPEALVADWRAAGLEVRPARAGEAAPSDCWRIEGHRGPVTGLPGWDEGRVWVQDAAAVAVADLCDAKEGQRVLDACAAPGGKTLRVASQGASVVAVDKGARRLKRVGENLARTGLQAEVRRHNWANGPMPGGDLFDAVLVDAPCSALGTLRRSPEVRWRRQEADLPGAAERQRAILEATSAHVAPGATLIYAVCSPEPEEGAEVIEAFLQEHPEFALVDQISTAPPIDDEDAHQAFRLERRSS